MPDLRAIATFTVPAIAALLGLLWLFGRKKPPSQRKHADPPDKQQYTRETKKIDDFPPHDTNTATLSANFVDGEGIGVGKSQVEIDDNVSTNVLSSSLPDAEAGQSNDSYEEVKANKANTFTSVATDYKPAQIIEQGDHVAQISRNEVNSFHQVDATGEHPSANSEVVQEIIEVPSVVTHCTTKPSSNSVSLSSLQNTTPESEKLIEEQIVAGVKVENIQSSPSVTTQESEGHQTDDSKCELVNDVSSERVPSTNNTSENVSQNTVSNLDTVENLNVNNSESTKSMSRSWHEEVDEVCDFGEDNDMSLPNCNNIDTNHKLDSKETKHSANVSDNGCAPNQTEKNDRNGNSTDRQREEGQNHSDASSNSDNHSEASNDSGKGGSVNDNSNHLANDEERVYEFNMPSDLCGLFIGTRGKTVKQLREQSGARIRLRNNPYTPDFQICVIEGPQSAIERACDIIRRKFPSIKYPGMDPMTPISTPVLVPEIMQMNLPEGVSVDVVVSSIVDAGRLFIQQPTHPTFPSLERLNTFMNQCYVQEGIVPDIPRPIESGVICAAPMLNGWYRAQIMAYYEDTDECDIKYVDYGGYSHISSQCLKQIRSDFMTLPFEAVECYLANITPLENESNYFSTEAAVVLEELTQGKLLQAQVVGRAEDGIPYIHIYQISGSALMVNRELVNRGVVRWMELSS